MHHDHTPIAHDKTCEVNGLATVKTMHACINTREGEEGYITWHPHVGMHGNSHGKRTRKAYLVVPSEADAAAADASPVAGCDACSCSEDMDMVRRTQ